MTMQANQGFGGGNAGTLGKSPENGTLQYDVLADFTSRTGESYKEGDRVYLPVDDETEGFVNDGTVKAVEVIGEKAGEVEPAPEVQASTHEQRREGRVARFLDSFRFEK